MEQNNIPKNHESQQEGEIDLLELALKVWAQRKLVIKWCSIAAVIGLVVAFSIPKEYNVSVKLALEASDVKSSKNGLASLADMAGLNIGAMNSTDAFSPIIYPDIVSSVPFMTELFDVEITPSKKEGQPTTVFNYMQDDIRSPWWSAVISLPFKALGWMSSLFSSEENTSSQAKVNPFRLTRKEERVVKALRKRIVVVADKKSMIITVSAKMQDPLIAAVLTDTVMQNLQEYIIEYRTNKARRDLEFTQKLFDESKSNYYAAQKRYARYMDANQNIVLRSVRTEQERLQNEMSLTYSLYNQMAQQLQMAKAKVQENSPVFTVVQPASVPLSASGTSKLMILLVFIFLGGAFSVSWILFGENLVRSFRPNHSPDAE